MHKFESAGFLNALSYSEACEAAVVAGREVLCIIQSNKRVLNLRTGSKLNLNYSSNDVQWFPSYAKDIIATAATNGSIVIWNVAKAKQDRVISEHLRAVNRISVHPSEPVLLLSASQDGLVKLWDLREKSTAALQFDGKSESVRDVCFHPINAFEFAMAFENGCVQKWDLRNPNIFERKINAHNGIALCLDWSEDGRFLASGGRDKLIKVWDVQGNDRKAYHCFQMIASVGRIKWRPGSNRQIAASSLVTDYRIHVWDTSSAFLPVQCFENHKNVTSGIVWKNRDTLLSVSKDKFFIEQPYNSGYSPYSLISKTNCSWTAANQIAYVTKLTEQPVLLDQNMHFEAVSTEDSDLFAILAAKYVVAGESNPTDCIRKNLETCESFTVDSQISRDLVNIWSILLECFSVNDCDRDLGQIFLANIESLFYDLTDIGQIQIIATFCLLAQDLLNLDGNPMIELYINQYLDLLARRKLWVPLNNIVNYCKIPSIRHRNQQSSTYHSSCQSCGKILTGTQEPGSWNCQKCRIKCGVCSICRMPVKGMYYWCIGCGHGGHANHLNTWFESGETVCPVKGCNHSCRSTEQK